ncbi:hypothetical protein HDU76_011576, partial [Blyttiomyces sp. JEL0837]
MSKTQSSTNLAKTRSRTTSVNSIKNAEAQTTITTTKSSTASPSTSRPGSALAKLVSSVSQKYLKSSGSSENIDTVGQPAGASSNSRRGSVQKSESHSHSRRASAATKEPNSFPLPALPSKEIDMDQKVSSLLGSKSKSGSRESVKMTRSTGSGRGSAVDLTSSTGSGGSADSPKLHKKRSSLVNLSRPASAKHGPALAPEVLA